MKEKFKKITITIMAVLIAFNSLICYNKLDYVQAEELPSLDAETAQMGDNSDSGLSGFADALLGIVTLIPKLETWAIVSLIRVLTGTIAAIGGGNWNWEDMSLEAILFNRVDLVRVNFFDTTGNQHLNSLRTSVATWYYSLRNLSIIILLGVLLYVGIRMAISTVAEEEAKYKKMFKDWVVSLMLLFVLHYIMIFVIDLNDVLVSIIDPRTQGNGVVSAMKEIETLIWDVRFTVGVGSLFVYAILVGMTIIYLFMYIKRMLTVGFLIIISPLITITYSIDKMGDGRSQALNTWFKEFIFNILIQPFHCIIYVVFINIAVTLMQSAPSFAASILAVIMMIFTFTAEKLVKKIFNFQSSSLGEAIGNTAAITAGISFLNKRGEKSAKDNPNLNKIPKMQGENMYPGSAGVQNSGQGGNSIAQGGSNVHQPNANSASAENISQPTEMPAASTATGASTKTKSNFLNGQANKTAALKMAKKAGKGLKWFATSGSLKMAQIAAFGMLGASTGTTKGMLAGAYAGNAINKGISSKLNRSTANKMVKSNEEYFAGAYKNFQAQTGRTDKQMQAFTQGLMDGTIDKDNLTDEERVYSSYVKKMSSTYGAVGEDDVQGRMQETMERIALKEGHVDRIIPKYGEAGAYQAPAQQTAQQEERPWLTDEHGARYRDYSDMFEPAEKGGRREVFEYENGLVSDISYHADGTKYNDASDKRISREDEELRKKYIHGEISKEQYLNARKGSNG